MNDDTKPQDDPAVAAELKGVPEELLDQGDSVEDALALLRGDLETAKQEVLYAKAETQNVRRRLEKDVADTRTYAATSFARDILSVSDNLARALDSIPAELREDDKLKNLIAGIEATGREIEKVFASHGDHPNRGDGHAAGPEPASGHARSAFRRGCTRHHRAGIAGRLHDQGPLAAPGDGGGGESGVMGMAASTVWRLGAALIISATTASAAATAPPQAPAGWKVVSTTSGDLTGDGKADLVQVIQRTDPNLVIRNERLGANELDTNPRRLLILARAGTGYRQIAAVDGFIPPAGDAESSCLADPLEEGGIAITRGVLSIDLRYWLSCGSYGVTGTTFKFRHEAGRFLLIGFDRMEFSRSSGQGEKVSVNFLTSRKAMTPFAIDDLIPERLKWTRIAPQRHYLDTLNLSACAPIDAVTTLC